MRARATEKLILGVLVVLTLAISSVIVTAVLMNGETETTLVEIDQRQEREQRQEIDFSEMVISPNEAKDIALREYPGKIVEVEMEEEDGKFIYEFEIEGKNIGEVVIDVMTGEVLNVEEEVKEEEVEEILRQQDLTEQEAKQLAVRELGGYASDFEIKYVAGQALYEVELTIGGGAEADVLIDPKTGEILYTEYDYDDD